MPYDFKANQFGRCKRSRQSPSVASVLKNHLSTQPERDGLDSWGQSTAGTILRGQCEVVYCGPSMTPYAQGPGEELSKYKTKLYGSGWLKQNISNTSTSRQHLRALKHFHVVLTSPVLLGSLLDSFQVLSLPVAQEGLTHLSSHQRSSRCRNERLSSSLCLACQVGVWL